MNETENITKFSIEFWSSQVYNNFKLTNQISLNEKMVTFVCIAV